MENDPDNLFSIDCSYLQVLCMEKMEMERDFHIRYWRAITAERNVSLTNSTSFTDARKLQERTRAWRWSSLHKYWTSGKKIQSWYSMQLISQISWQYEEPKESLRTRGENMADSTGIQAVFQAYKNLEKAKRNVRLEGLEEFTDDQLFFISFAAVSQNFYVFFPFPQENMHFVMFRLYLNEFLITGTVMVRGWNSEVRGETEKIQGRTQSSKFESFGLRFQHGRLRRSV